MNVYFNKALYLIIIILSLIACNVKDVEEIKIKHLEHIIVKNIQPRAEDVSTLDGIINAYYEIISGPKGQERNWARDRSLYIEGIKFVSTKKINSQPIIKILTHQEYVDAVNKELVDEGFFEKEIGRAVRTFGNITHVFSSYESRRTIDGPVIARGINSMELFYDGNRYWIASAIWDVERADNPIPSDMILSKQFTQKIKQ